MKRLGYVARMGKEV